MDHKSSLIQRLNNQEDGYVERKLGSANAFDIRKTIVGFANSVSEGVKGILFLGVSDDGKIVGVSSTDSLQKTIRNICKRDCYPEIKYQSEVIEIDGKYVIAVIIPESTNKPHFSGPAFVRIGPQTEIASEQMFKELIFSRTDKCREIIKNKGNICTVHAIGRRLLSHRAVGLGHAETAECRIEECNPHYVRLNKIDSGTNFNIQLSDISISYDENKYRLKLIVK